MSSSAYAWATRAAARPTLDDHVARAISSPAERLGAGLARSLGRRVPHDITGIGAAPHAGLRVVPQEHRSEREAAEVGEDGADRAGPHPDWDFSQVRIHTDAAARRSAAAIDAAAYTTGDHIVFGADRYRPDSESGRRLLLHELAHVAQQRRAGHAARRHGPGVGSEPVIQRQPAGTDERRRATSSRPAAGRKGAGSAQTIPIDPNALNREIHEAAVRALRRADGIAALRRRAPALTLPPLVLTLPGRPRPAFTLPTTPLQLSLTDIDPSPAPAPAGQANQAATAPPTAASPQPPELQPPSPMFSSWTNAAQVLPYGHANWEYNQVLQGGSGGTSIGSQGSARLGLGRGLEAGLVANVAQSAGAPASGATGLTLHAGPTRLSTERFSGGILGMASIGTGTVPSGSQGVVVNASVVPLLSRKVDAPSGSEDEQRQIDIDPLAPTYSSAGSFGPGTTPAPHLLTAPAMAQYTRPLDPHSSVSIEGMVSPGVALGTLGARTPLVGGRAGLGVGFSHTSGGPTNMSAFGINLNASTDLTTAGTSYAVFLTLTFSDAFYAPWAPRPAP